MDHVYHDARASECQKSLLSDRIHIFRLARLPRILCILYVNYNRFRQMFMDTIRQCLHKNRNYMRWRPLICKQWIA